ncbi:DUF6313 family protein [Streptomyces sp. NPDC006984]|uniref:DUF6313 family protein n=1 Tax=Streptomyces sp. NPDC006984 TaxID=3155463 RepID=UPI0033C25434
MITLYDLHHNGSPDDKRFVETFGKLHETWEEAQRHWRLTVLHYQHRVKYMQGLSGAEKDQYAENLAQTTLWYYAKSGVCIAPRNRLKV